MVEGGVDGLAVSHYAMGELDEYRDAAAARPGDPPVQGLLPWWRAELLVQRETSRKYRVNTALLTDPWVFGSAWQGGSVSAEGEHGQSDECFGGSGI